MNPETISAELEALPRDDSFEWRTDELVDRWKRQEPGLEAVEPILRFMEGHRDVELGTPGALVQFVEGIEGYEDLLLASLARGPTPHTVWMLNRILNATKERNARSRLLLAMRNAGRHPDADDLTRQQAAHFLELQGEPRD